LSDFNTFWHQNFSHNLTSHDSCPLHLINVSTLPCKTHRTSFVAVPGTLQTRLVCNVGVFIIIFVLRSKYQSVSDCAGLASTCSHKLSNQQCQCVYCLWLQLWTPPFFEWRLLQREARKCHYFWLYNVVKKWTPVIFSNDFNKYWSVSAIFGTENTQSVPDVHMCNLRVLMKQGISLG